MSILLFLLLLFFFLIPVRSSLRPGFYSETCPEAELIVRDTLRRAMVKETRAAASVMRLQFHDCFVNGCDGSLLLDDHPNFEGEKSGLSNINSLRSFEVIDEIKEEIEKKCPRIVSCADIVIMAARDAVVLSGGPSWEVKLGRKDSLTASKQASDEIMPSPRLNASTLINVFKKFNLTTKDLVSLSGSHTLGQVRCFSFFVRLYNQSGSNRPDPSIELGFRKKLEKLCPLNGDKNVTTGLDGTPERFDNQYYKDLVRGRGVMNSDETLFGCSETKKYVTMFSKNEGEFFRAFVDGMIKLGDLQSGMPGEIRRNCRVVNTEKRQLMSM